MSKDGFEKLADKKSEMFARAEVLRERLAKVLKQEPESQIEEQYPEIENMINGVGLTIELMELMGTGKKF